MPTQLPIEEIKTQMMKFARKDLVFGCEIELKKKRGIAFMFHNGKALIKGENVFFLKDRFKKIIGSPLLLSDVLKAIANQQRWLFSLLYNNDEITIRLIDAEYKTLEIYIEWKHSIIYFNDLPEKTQRQIHAILFPNQE